MVRLPHYFSASELHFPWHSPSLSETLRSTYRNTLLLLSDDWHLVAPGRSRISFVPEKAMHLRKKKCDQRKRLLIAAIAVFSGAN